MHSWVFRNRDRLRVIYGPAPSPPRAAASSTNEQVGQTVRRRSYVVVFPMPKRRSA